jgi:plastocyanin
MVRDARFRPSATVGWCFAIGLAALALLSACSAAAASPATGTSSPAGTATPRATPSSEVSSTTEPAASAPPGAITVELAGPPPHFVPADLTAPAGDVVFFLHNSSQGTHTLAIGHELYKALAISGNVPKGAAAAFTVHGLRAGDYIIWCTIDAHAVDGMVGTLTVK